MFIGSSRPINRMSRTKQLAAAHLPHDIVARIDS
jgi:hypothetical protein